MSNENEWLDIPAFLSREDRENLYSGNFKPDERLMLLDKKIAQYYADTPDSMSNKDALPIHKDFKKWCIDSGYTLEEINRAKRNCRDL